MAAIQSVVALSAGPRLPARRLPAGAARPSAPPRGRAAVVVYANGAPRMSEADMYQGVDSMPQQMQLQHTAVGGSPPWYVIGPAAFGGLIIALRAMRMMKKKRSKGDRLDERGFRKGGVADDKAYSQAIKGMRRIQYEELSDAQIEAARRRRRRDVEQDSPPLDLDNIDLPDNHPFAVKRNLAPEEEMLQRSRFSARRGLSAEDMEHLRQQQALADQMDAEGEAREAARRARG